MSVVDYILDGLEAELALERELGVRSIECDRSLLLNEVKATPFTPPPKPTPTPRTTPQSPPPPPGPALDFVFLHDRALSAAGVEMLSKIVVALGKTADSAPLVIAPPLPKAKVYVVLGGLALRKFFPSVKGGAPGNWTNGPNGEQVLITFSPEYILRFPVVTPAVKQMKLGMWTSLKSVLQRVRLNHG